MKFNNVYVIDDEKFDRLFYKRMIDRAGLVKNLRLYASAEEALEDLRSGENRPELILLDINMPRMNGFEFLEQIDRDLATSNPPTTVAMLTTSTDPRDMERANDFASVKYFFSKPLKVDFLADMTEMME